MHEKFPFIILAGSPPQRDALMEYADVDYKALIEIEGKTMLTWVLEAIVKSGRASYILITGVPEDLVTLPEGLDPSTVSFLDIEGAFVDKIHKSGNHLIELSESNSNIFAKDRHHAIFMSVDIPALTVKAINDFLSSCTDNDIKFYHTIVHRREMEREFPHSGRSWIHIKGNNDYCGGDMDMVDVYTIRENYDLIKTLTENRKSFITGLLKISPLTVIRYLLKRVEFDEIEGLMTRVFKFRSKAVVSPNPEIGFDVDKPYQLDIIREFMAKKIENSSET